MLNSVGDRSASLQQALVDEMGSFRNTISNRKRALIYFAGIVFVVLIYSYPTLRARSELQSTTLPPMFAADLSLYLNLSDAPATDRSQFLNPYYLVRVPYNGTGYLQFHLGPALFAMLREALGGRLWLSVFVWNVLWWSLLNIFVVWLLKRFLPGASSGLVMLGLALLMLFNFGILKTLLAAWAHLPSLASFETLGLPFMRAFLPVMPVTFLVVYLGLQMEALRRQNAMLIWLAMGALQFVSLASFPYVTLVMAGITAVSATWQVLFNGNRQTRLIVVAYSLLCAIADSSFALRGPLDFYSNHTSSIRFQPALLPHLVGGNWLILAVITGAVIVNHQLSPEVKWPLVGLGATNLIIMLGDALVPAKTILLSIHATYFIHTSTTILFIFLISATLVRSRVKSSRWGSRMAIAFAFMIAIVVVNGLLLSLGSYRGYLSYNKEQAELAKALGGLYRLNRDVLVIARSQNADDLCGWIFSLTQSQVLYCTDAELMHTPQQNTDIHRFRQAIYLYLTGRDSDSLRRMLAEPSRLTLMYQLGYWAEAASRSPEEQQAGVRSIEHELIPLLERVEQGDVAVSKLFQQFRRIVVVDKPDNPTFSKDRLASFLKFEDEQQCGHLQVRTYTASIGPYKQPGSAQELRTHLGSNSSR